MSSDTIFIGVCSIIAALIGALLNAYAKSYFDNKGIRDNNNPLKNKNHSNKFADPESITTPLATKKQKINYDILNNYWIVFSLRFLFASALIFGVFSFASFLRTSNKIKEYKENLSNFIGNTFSFIKLALFYLGISIAVLFVCFILYRLILYFFYADNPDDIKKLKTKESQPDFPKPRYVCCLNNGCGHIVEAYDTPYTCPHCKTTSSFLEEEIALPYGVNYYCSRCYQNGIWYQKELKTCPYCNGLLISSQ